MRSNSWSYWEHWQVIFGKDRADGTIVEDLMEAVNILYSHDNLHSPGGNFGQTVGLGDEPAVDPLGGNGSPEGAAESTGQSTHRTGSSLGTGKKRKNDLGIDRLIEMLGKMHNDTNARLECLSLRIGYKFNLSKARKEVFELLGRLPGLSREQKFDFGEIILEKVESLDFFLGMPEEDRVAYVFCALAKYG